MLQQVRSRDSSPTLMTSRPALLPAIGGMGLSGGISSSTMSLHGRQMEVLSDSYLWGWLTCNTHRVWGLKSRVYCCCLGMESSLLLSQPGGQLSQDSQVKNCRGQFCIALRNQHVPKQQPRCRTSAWPLVVIDPHYYRATGIDMALRWQHTRTSPWP